MNRYLCGVTLSSTEKGRVKKAGFYDIHEDTFFKINIVNNRASKIFNLKFNSKYLINTQKVCNFGINNFKNGFVYIFPVNDNLFSKLNKISGVDSLNYREIAKQFGIEEWIL